MSEWLSVLLLLAGAACADAPIAGPEEYTLRLTPELSTLHRGDVVFVDVEVVDARGRPVAGPIVLSTDDATVATIDGSGRLRAVREGNTALRAATPVGDGSVSISVADRPAAMTLGTFNGADLPFLFDADSVDWYGERQYHEVYVVSGALVLDGAPQPTYELEVRFEQFRVHDDGERQLALRWREYDRGLVDYDAAGDLGMTSVIVAPLHHSAAVSRGGMLVDYRVPGTDDHLALRYVR